jgi:acetoacetyl-CoA synthetase
MRPAAGISGAPDPIWRPSAPVLSRSWVTAFRPWLASARDLRFDDYPQLRARYIDRMEDFWSSIWDYFGIQARIPQSRVLDDATMPHARWFPGATLNYVDHILRAGSGEAAAVISPTKPERRLCCRGPVTP